ncbi:MAG TPA: hypothetical protein VFD01_17075 [Candidatus Dormibacteraeota bacterium]|nr:hypothetical protein [Candidatus Dormibacteraeota bacterium]
MPIGGSTTPVQSSAPVQGGAGNLARPGPAALIEVPIDFRTEPYESAPAANGVATIALPAPAKGYAYRVERINVHTNSGGATTCAVMLGDPSDPTSRIDYTPDGNDDVADEFSPILVPGSVTLSLVWSGMTNGALAYARIQYRVVQLVAVNLAEFLGAGLGL